MLAPNSNKKWALIPSDPAIFNDMIQQYGVEDTKVEEVLSLDFEDLSNNGAVHGLMFVSRYIEDELPNNFDQPDPDADNVIFIAQVVTNVCGTLALLAVLLNANINRGTILNNFLDFTQGFSPINRGLCLGNCQEIRNIHDAYATNANHSAESTMDDAMSDMSDSNQAEYIDVDDFHYVTYIYKNGYLWELDGLKHRPVKLAECNQDNWLEKVKPVLEQRMNSSMENELTFNLMAITHNPYKSILAANDTYKKCRDKVRHVMKKSHKPPAIKRLSTIFFNSIDSTTPLHHLLVEIWEDLRLDQHESAQNKLSQLETQIHELELKINFMEEERTSGLIDVARQKFDYFPFISALLETGIRMNVVDKKIIKSVPAKYLPKKKKTKSK